MQSLGETWACFHMDYPLWVHTKSTTKRKRSKFSILGSPTTLTTKREQGTDHCQTLTQAKEKHKQPLVGRWEHLREFT